MKTLHNKESCCLDYAQFCRSTQDIFSGLPATNDQNVEFSILVQARCVGMTWKKVVGDVKVCELMILQVTISYKKYLKNI